MPIARRNRISSQRGIDHPEMCGTRPARAPGGRTDRAHYGTRPPLPQLGKTLTGDLTDAPAVAYLRGTGRFFRIRGTHVPYRRSAWTS